LTMAKCTKCHICVEHFVPRTCYYGSENKKTPVVTFPADAGSVSLRAGLSG
jgi:hypothetical protein